MRYQGVQAQEPGPALRQAFVTGATGLLGNNLVRELAARGIAVRALARSVDKARQQFADLPQVQVVKGDMGEVGAFAAALAGCDVPPPISVTATRAAPLGRTAAHQCGRHGGADRRGARRGRASIRAYILDCRARRTARHADR